LFGRAQHAQTNQHSIHLNCVSPDLFSKADFWMEFIQTEIPDVLVLQPKVFGDERGFFLETFRKSEFIAAGIHQDFVQDNHSRSRRGVLRGLHYQVQQVQGKLFRVIAGEVFDVAVDLRKSSATFGRWVGIHLSAENKYQVWVPPGFAHGFYVMSDWAEVVYKVTDYWAPEYERTLLWNDLQLNIAWPVAPGEIPQLSAKDQQGALLRDLATTELFV
jgi:dTDP-4-dehydrorhamnose 3,5-epimerase